jgi:hypothetical protein
LQFVEARGLRLWGVGEVLAVEVLVEIVRILLSSIFIRLKDVVTNPTFFISDLLLLIVGILLRTIHRVVRVPPAHVKRSRLQLRRGRVLQ